MGDTPTTFDRLLRRLKDHPVIAVVGLVATLGVGALTLANSADEFADRMADGEAQLVDFRVVADTAGVIALRTQLVDDHVGAEYAKRLPILEIILRNPSSKSVVLSSLDLAFDRVTAPDDLGYMCNMIMVGWHANLLLDASKPNQSKQFPIAQLIEPGKAERLVILPVADLKSEYRVTGHITYNGDRSLVLPTRSLSLPHHPCGVRVEAESVFVVDG